jgi:hypothetical protein
VVGDKRTIINEPNHIIIYFFWKLSYFKLRMNFHFHNFIDLKCLQIIKTIDKVDKLLKRSLEKEN